LHEWKHADPGAVPGFRIAVREETGASWKAAGTPLRLVNRARLQWRDKLPPASCPGAGHLPGEILRFSTP
jgi:hypothetical protein